MSIKSVSTTTPIINLEDNSVQFNKQVDVISKTEAEKSKVLGFDKSSETEKLSPNEVAARRNGISFETQRAGLILKLKGKDDPKLEYGKLIDRNKNVYSRNSNDIKNDGLYGIKVEVAAGDNGENMLFKGYQAAAKAAGYSDLEAFNIAELRISEIPEAKRTLVDVDVKKGTFGSAKDKTEIQTLQKSGDLDFWVTGGEIKHFDTLKNRHELFDAVTKGEPLTDEMMLKAGLDPAKFKEILKEIGYQPVPTFDEAVSKLAAEKFDEIMAMQKESFSKPYIDNFHKTEWYGKTDQEIKGMVYDQAKTEIRNKIGKGEMQVRNSDKPTALVATNIPKWRTDVKLFIEKYLPGLADLNTPEGIKTTAVESFVYKWLNARSFGATDFYVDKSRFHNQKELDIANAFGFAGTVVGELQNLKIAGKTIEVAMNTPRIARAINTLNKSGKIGGAIVQSLPTAATFGTVETVKESVKAAKGDSDGLLPAVKNVGRESTIGAAFGVLAPLPVVSRVLSVGATTYGINKVFGVSDSEAVQSAVTNALFSIMGGRGGKNAPRTFEELNGRNIQIINPQGKTAVVKVNISPEGKVSIEPLAHKGKLPADYKFSTTIVDAKTANRLAESRLTEIRGNLSPKAKIEFDAMRSSSKTTSEFVQKMKGDPVKMFEAIAAKKANAPAKIKAEQEAMAKAKTLIDNPQFTNKPLVKEALTKNDQLKIETLREQISIELTKSKLEVQYSKAEGYEIQTGVKIHQDSGFKTIDEWLKAHPKLTIEKTKGLVVFDGKVWQPTTDMDIAVVKKTTDGKFEIVRTEEVKSGGKDTASDAQEQVETTIDALAKIKTGDSSVKIFVGENDITDNYKVSDRLKTVKRGADDRQNFDEKVGLTSNQIKQLAEEIVANQIKGGNK